MNANQKFILKVLKDIHPTLEEHELNEFIAKNVYRNLDEGLFSIDILQEEVERVHKAVITQKGENYRLQVHNEHRQRNSIPERKI